MITRDQAIDGAGRLQVSCQGAPGLTGIVMSYELRHDVVTVALNGAPHARLAAPRSWLEVAGDG